MSVVSHWQTHLANNQVRRYKRTLDTLLFLLYTGNATMAKRGITPAIVNSTYIAVPAIHRGLGQSNKQHIPYCFYCTKVKSHIKQPVVLCADRTT